MSYQIEAYQRERERVRYDAAVSICLVRLAEVRPFAVAIEVAFLLVLVVAMTVWCMRFCMRCSMRGVKMPVALVATGTQTVREMADLRESTVEAIRGHLRRRGLRADGTKEVLALRLHEHLLHEARVS